MEKTKLKELIDAIDGVGFEVKSLEEGSTGTLLQKGDPWSYRITLERLHERSTRKE